MLCFCCKLQFVILAEKTNVFFRESLSRCRFPPVKITTLYISSCQHGLLCTFLQFSSLPQQLSLTYICLKTWGGSLCAAFAFTSVVVAFVPWQIDFMTDGLFLCFFFFFSPPGVEKATRESAVTSFCLRLTPSCLTQVSFHIC